VLKVPLNPNSINQSPKLGAVGKFTCGVGSVEKMLGNIADKLRHTRSAYSVGSVLLSVHEDGK